jgi:hypothetical protein
LNRRVRLAFAILITALAACAVAACGDDPLPVKTIAASEFADPRAGIAFRAPAGARLGDGAGEQIVVLRRGKATLVISRFERDEPLPRSATELRRAARSLEQEYIRAGVADGSHLDGVVAKPIHASGHGAVSALVRTVSQGGVRRVALHRHFYAYGAEIVIDAVTLEKELDNASTALFDPVLDSLKITKPRD